MPFSGSKGPRTFASMWTATQPSEYERQYERQRRRQKSAQPGFRVDFSFYSLALPFPPRKATRVTICSQCSPNVHPSHQAVKWRFRPPHLCLFSLSLCVYALLTLLVSFSLLLHTLVIYFCPHVLPIVLSFTKPPCNLMHHLSLCVIFMIVNEVLYIPRVTTVHCNGHFVSVCLSPCIRKLSCSTQTLVYFNCIEVQLTQSLAFLSLAFYYAQCSHLHGHMDVKRQMGREAGARLQVDLQQWISDL